jgi:hypothetical protein
MWFGGRLLNNFIDTALQIKNLDLNKWIIIPDSSFPNTLLSAVTLNQVLSGHPDHDRILDSLKHNPGLRV